MNRVDGKLRVALATKFPYDEREAFTGLKQVSLQLSNALAKRDEVELIVISGSDRIQQIEHRTEPSHRIIFFPYPNDWLYYGTFYAPAFLALRSQLLKLKPDIVHCQAIAETPVGSLLSGLPLVTTIHGISAGESIAARSLKIRAAYRVQSLVEGWYVKRLRNVIAISPYVERFVRAHNSHALFYRIANPIDPQFFDVDLHATNPAPRTLLIVGSINPRKGHDLLIEALRGLSSEVRLTIAGEQVISTYAHELNEKIRAFGLSARVRWLGPISQTRLIEEMKSHQIVCLPSREETAPMILAQAMAVGNICVASDAGGIPDMVRDGENGFLCKRNDANDLRRTLARVFNFPSAQLSEMRVKNRAFAEKTFRPDQVAAQTVAVYRKIIGEQ